MIGPLRQIALLSLAFAEMFALGGCAPVVMQGTQMLMSGAIRGSSRFSQRLNFDAREIEFSPDSRTLLVSFVYEKETSEPEWALLDLRAMAMRDTALEVCGKQSTKTDGLTDVRTSPDGAFILGRRVQSKSAAPGLFMRPAAAGPLTEVSAFNPDYFFMRGSDAIVLTRNVFPAESAQEGGADGIYIRAYDLRRKTYVDPRNLEPVSSAETDQIVLSRVAYAGLAPFDAIGLGPENRSLVFVGQAESDEAPVLEPLKAALKAKGESIAYADVLLFQLDRENGTLRLHPLMEKILSDPILPEGSKFPRIARVSMGSDGSIFFVLWGGPTVFRFRDGAIAAVMNLPPQIETAKIQSFAVSPDEKWLALRAWARDNADVDAIVANSVGRIVYRIDRRMARPAVCTAPGRPETYQNCFSTKSVDRPCF